MIRLAVRCPPEAADRVLAELLELSPAGVEEAHGEDWAEFAIYGAEGELPDLGAVTAITDDGKLEVSAKPVPEDWADRWQRFHKPVTVAGRLYVRPPWAPPPRDELIDLVIDPGQGFGTGAHPTTRLCLELLCDLADEGPPTGPLADWGTGSGVLAIAASRLGWSPVRACDHDPAAVEEATRNAAENGVAVEVIRADVRSGGPPAAPSVVANLVSPLLEIVAQRMSAGEIEVPGQLVASGILAPEADRVAGAFAAAGLAESARRTAGDWSAIRLYRR